MLLVKQYLEENISWWKCNHVTCSCSMILPEIFISGLAIHTRPFCSLVYFVYGAIAKHSHYDVIKSLEVLPNYA